MVNRQVIRCNVCNALTLVRIQVGWQETFPIRIPCGSCGIQISGTVKFDFANVKGPHVDYENATLTDEADGTFHLEISSEFPTTKLKQSNRELMEGRSTPFMRAFGKMSQQGYEEFGESVHRIVYMAKNDWPRVRRVNELWISRRLDLLRNDIREFLPAGRFPMSTPAEAFWGVRTLTGIFLSPVVSDAEREKWANTIRNAVRNLDPARRLSLQAGVLELENRATLKKYDGRKLQLLENFVAMVPALIPALSLKYLRGGNKIDLQVDGMTTGSLDDLKSFFVDAFELAADLQLLTAIWNNVIHRGDWNQVYAKRRDVRTFAEFASKKKGERLQFMDARETFDPLLAASQESRLRNAFAHSSVSYNPTTQLITYYPKGEEDPADMQTLFILELATKCLDMVQSIELTSDLLVASRYVLESNWNLPI